MSNDLSYFLAEKFCETIHKRAGGPAVKFQNSQFETNPTKRESFAIYGDYEITLKDESYGVRVEIDHANTGTLDSFGSRLDGEFQPKGLIKSIIQDKGFTTVVVIKVEITKKEPTEELARIFIETVMQPILKKAYSS